MEANVNIKRIKPPVIDLSALISILVMVEKSSSLLFFFLTKLTHAQVTIMALTSELTQQRDEFPRRLLCFIDDFRPFSWGVIDFHRQCKHSFRHSSTPAFSLVCRSRSQLSSRCSLFIGGPQRNKDQHGLQTTDSSVLKFFQLKKNPSCVCAED